MWLLKQRYLEELKKAKETPCGRGSSGEGNCCQDCGRFRLVGEFDIDIQTNIKALRKAGTPVNNVRVIAQSLCTVRYRTVQCKGIEP